MPMTETDDIVEKKSQAIKETANGEYQIFLFGNSDLEIQELDDIYRVGFGDHLPITQEEHRAMASHGDTIGIREKSSGKLVAVRAMVYQKDQSNPIDKHIQSHHAYQNHTVIVPEARGRGLIYELTAASRDIAMKKGKTSILTCTSVENAANLKALTRLGYQISMYSPDHFGQGEHRYMLEHTFDEDYMRLDEWYLSLLNSGRVSVDSIEPDAPVQCISASNTRVAAQLIELGYRGTRAASHDGELVLFFEHTSFITLGSRIRNHCFTQQPDSLEASRDTLSDEINQLARYFQGHTQMEQELSIAGSLININVHQDRTLTSSAIYQLTYPLEDEAGVAPTVENGLWPVLQEHAGQELLEAIARIPDGDVILLGCSTRGSLRGAEDIADMTGGRVTVVDFDDKALSMLEAAKQEGTHVEKVDLSQPKDFAKPFSLAVSDFVHSFIPRKKWEGFMGNVNAWVRPGGYYFGAVYIFDPLYVNQDEIELSGSYRRDKIFEYLTESQGIGSSIGSIVGDLVKYRHHQSFVTNAARSATNNFQGVNEIGAYLQGGDFSLITSVVGDLPHIAGTGLRRVVFIAKKA